MSVSPTPEEAAATIAENVGHISRGCRSGRSHNPNVYEQAIEDALAVLVAALRDARRELAETRTALRRIERNAENNGDEFTRMLARAALGGAAEETQP